MRGAVVMDGSLRGVPVGTQPIWLDPKFPAGVALCRYEISRLDAQLLTGLSLAAAPSGTGELTISALVCGSGVVTFKAAGGQPGRTYSLMLSATRSDGVVRGYLLNLRVDPVLAADQAQAVPSAGFGTALTWTGP